MKRFIQLTLASLVTLLGLTFTAPLMAPADAIDVFSGACDGADTGEVADGADTGTDGGLGGAAADDGVATEGGGGGSSSICGAAKQDDAPKIVTNVINAILFVLGIGAVVMIVIGGIRYTTSNGDASAVKGAKDTVLYAVVGLVVAMMAFLIVNFVIDRLGK